MNERVGRAFIAAGALSGFVAVGAGAFGAHGLKPHLSADHLATWETAAHYQLIHSVMLVVVGLAGERLGTGVVVWSGRLFGVGILLFAGSLYALAVAGVRVLGAITPFGGLCFLAGWLCLAAAAMKSGPPPAER